jgi:hypothetical protein
LAERFPVESKVGEVVRDLISGAEHYGDAGLALLTEISLRCLETEALRLATERDEATPTNAYPLVAFQTQRVHDLLSGDPGAIDGLAVGIQFAAERGTNEQRARVHAAKFQLAFALGSTEDYAHRLCGATHGEWSPEERARMLVAHFDARTADDFRELLQLANQALIAQDAWLATQLARNVERSLPSTFRADSLAAVRSGPDARTRNVSEYGTEVPSYDDVRA